MTAVISFLAGLAVQLGPPPPLVYLIEVPAKTLTDEGRAASRTILEKLQPGYVRIAPAPVAAGAFGRCREEEEGAERCLSGALGQARVGAGTVVLVPSEKDGVLQWLCVGADVRPFVAARQSVSLGPLADLYSGGESELLHLASACLTYAGNQGGW